MKKIAFLLVSFFCFLSVYATKTSGYHIDITASQLANKQLFLASYFNGKVYVVDTIQLNDKGKGVFQKKKPLNEGMYLVYLHSARYYEMLIGSEQNISVKIDTTSASGFQASGAPQTDAFMAFGKYMAQKHKEQKVLQDEYEAAKDDSIKQKAVQEKFKQLDEEVKAHQALLGQEYKGQIFGLFVNSLITPQYPKELQNIQPTDREGMMARYQYAKKHYWDNIDVADRRSWRLNMLNQKLDDYTQKVLIQIPDSIIPEVINLIEKTKKDSVCFELMTNYMINYSVTSKIMGMDKLLVTIADKYYFTGQAYWADSTIMANVTSEVKKVRYNQIGMKGQNLPLVKYDGTPFKVYDVKAPFTLLFFFEPSCGHCKEVTPKIHEIYQKYKDKGFKVIAIYTMTDKKEWTDFIEKNNLQDWINAWDPNRDSYYWQFYDTSTTPGVYLLDKDKSIFAKKIDAKSLEIILENELK